MNLALVPADSAAERARLLLMARKLYRFTEMLSYPALFFGVALWLYYGIGRGAGQYWMHAKLVIVLLAVGYTHSCDVLLKKFEKNLHTRSHVWFRWYNEAPVVLLLVAVILVVVKPF